MIELKDIQRIYFIGIGGIGMSAIARYFNAAGVVVSGYDKTPTPLSRKLESEGITIHYTDEVGLLDESVQLVVFTPAIPANHLQLTWYRQHRYSVVKRSDVLQIITRDSFNICVAGTHGKTSISTLIGHLLKHTGYGCNAFLGGVSVNYETNFWSSSNKVSVVEADEYDRSFLKLNPDIAIVTSMDADHLDIYGTVEAMEEAFVQFAERIKPNGLLIRKQLLKKLDEAQVRKTLTYQLRLDETNEANHHNHESDHEHDHDMEDGPDVYAENIRVEAGGYRFDAQISQQQIKDIRLPMGGLHNIENALAALTVAVALGINEEKIKAAIAAYKGVKRRFEYLLNEWNEEGRGRVFIDDYAHHPEELRALLLGAKDLFPQLHCTIVFQPHLFTRTRDHAKGFAEVLNLADRVILLPIYPARELPIEGISSSLIADGLSPNKVSIVPGDELQSVLAFDSLELLITAGAGDIDRQLPVLIQKFKNAMGG